MGLPAFRSTSRHASVSPKGTVGVKPQSFVSVPMV